MDGRQAGSGRASGQLRVRLETREYSGKLVHSVLVRSNDPQAKLLEVKVEAMVQPPAKQRASGPARTSTLGDRRHILAPA